MKIGVTRTNGEPRIEHYENVERMVVDGTDNNRLIIELSDGSRWSIPADEYTTIVGMPAPTPKRTTTRTNKRKQAS